MHKEIIGNTEFTFKRVDLNAAEMNDIYKLRFEVYCHECHFIREEDYPDNIEKDILDQHSVQFDTSNQDGIIGTARLILDNPYGFPLETHCRNTLHRDISILDRKRLAEISRLVISKKMRRRKDDGLYYTPEYGDNRRSSDMDIMRRIKPMAFGLYREIYQECKRRGVTHLLALMEKTLWLLLKIHHFEFEQIGDTIHFYGPVAPYICYIEDAERNVYEKSPELYKYLVDGLEPQYLPRFVK